VVEMSELKQKRVTDFFSGGAIRSPALMLFDDATNNPPPGSAKRRRLSRELEGQRAIDAGQEKIGMQSCIKCSMVYSVDVEADVEDHERHCNGREDREELTVRKNTLDGWMKNILGLVPGHYRYPYTGPCTVILEVKQDCEVRSLKSKVEKIVENRVNKSLGFTEEGSMWVSNLSSTFSNPSPSPSPSTHSSQSSTVSSQSTVLPISRRKAYMAIVRDEKGNSSIGGIVLAESVYRAIDVDENKLIRAERLLGVNRLWVEEEMRGKGIATMMIEEARGSFYHIPIPRSRVVFSEPTKDGEKFARRYLSENESEEKRGRLLVYNLGNGEKWKETMKKMIEMRRNREITVDEGRNTVEDEDEKNENTVDESIDDESSRSPLSEQL
ncbi:hypothetical protein PFISCL1PPCAC_10803, partial [Pristionchus fissidentatus]